MKQINFKKPTPQGNVDGICRIIGSFIYFKYNNSSQTKQVIDQFKKRGLDIKEGKGWIKVDLIGKNESIKLGNEIIDITEDTEETIENKLFKFYKNQYEKMGFYIETQNEKKI